MQFSLEARTASLSVGEFAAFASGPRESGGGSAGLWRAQLGQHWHAELRARTLAAAPDARFEVALEEEITHRGWRLTLAGRIDQLVPATGAEPLLREIKSVSHPLPADEAALRTDYPAYFLQLATYLVLRRARREPARGELVFVEVASGLVQTVALSPFDEALVLHQLDAVVEFLQHRRHAGERRRALRFQPPFAALRPGQESIQAGLGAALARASVVLFEAPTGYGKTGCTLEFALGALRSGRFQRLVWLTGKSTGQLQVVRTLKAMSDPRPGNLLRDTPPAALPPGPPASSNPLGYSTPAPAGDPSNPLGYSARGANPGLSGSNNPIGDAAHAAPLPYWQVRNKGEHCVNDVFHCVRDACGFLNGCAERWPGSGLAKFYLAEQAPRDLDALRAAGRAARICPYEITRAALPYHDVWIGDYNYVFAPANRSLFSEQPGFAPAETLLVVDEAHNLPARVADAHSHLARADDALALLAELDHRRAPADLQLAAEQWARLLGRLGSSDAVDAETESAVHDAVGRLAELVMTLPLDYAALGPEHSRTLWQFAALEDFLSDSTLKKLLWVPRPGELAFTCLDAAEAIGAILQSFGGALLMSATLSPFEHTAMACGLEAPGGLASLRAPAPWRDGAYDVAVDLRVDTTLKHRARHSAATAATIESLRASSAAAVAVFFPSYAYADAVLGVLEQRSAALRVAMQPKLPDLAAQAAWVEESLALADVLFLVLGSSFAEGIDLLGGRVTHAMVVGPALPEVNAVQRARMDTFAALGRDAAFRRVYQVPGLQKVNQALGRLVRAPGQKAKVLLHCRRFADPSYAGLLAPEYQMYREITSEAELGAWLGPAR